ncbi:GIY-YIG catalytic domain [Popillia japonica]|uniref:Structure-specific endonuclease subunit SLX1 homolog n=1 Tax=Popillia japonica TaxID=7064 RepID=A0AAW1MGP4_POPJA
MNDIHTVENFYGVYLLYCKNPKYKGRTYIGYTVDPNRRIKQHNKGKDYGGAWKTSNKGPWVMALIIHGFPNDIAALRFEWAWQHPNRSRRLNHLPKRKAREKAYDYCILILSEMLNVGPWNRLPLTIRWLEQELAKDFVNLKLPPIHMPVCYGPVISKKLPKQRPEEDSEEIVQIDYCFICNKRIISEKKLTCLNTSCDIISHITCLSEHFLSVGEYVPVEGTCPKCKQIFLWGDIVRKYKGCYGTLNVTLNVKGDDFYSSDSD